MISPQPGMTLFIHNIAPFSLEPLTDLVVGAHANTPFQYLFTADLT